MLVNAPHPLAISTYDGSGQCVHPDVVLTNGAFYDTAYAMVMEPFPFADASLENPSIVASNDGMQWDVPPGLINPIVDPPPSAAGWNSDAALFNDANQVLRLYYRYNSGQGETTLFLKQSEDGIRWSPPTNLFRCPNSAQFASPSIVRFRDALGMVFIDTLNQTVGLLRSVDGAEWDGLSTLGSFPAAWHVAALSHLDSLFLLLTDQRALFLLCYRNGSTLQLFDGEVWVPLDPWLQGCHSAARPPAILTPSEAGWDCGGIYRASFQVEHGMLRVWYSAYSQDGQWHIGYTQGSFPDW
jgi:hypothetical protein